MHDELGLETRTLARPIQAAWISLVSVSVLALVPIIAFVYVPFRNTIVGIATSSLVALAALGAIGGHLGGASRWRASLRMTIGGAVAMVIAAGIDRLLGFIVTA